MNARKIIIDTDPGQDDAVAILLALASTEEIELLAVTCVAGNVPLALTCRNARMICELAGRPDVAIYAGCDRPLKRKLVTAEHVHGRSGLDGADLPDPMMPLADGHAVEALIDILRREPAGSVTLCPIGPLTNIASAFRKAPDIVDRVQEIVLMGGAWDAHGNVTPCAEFNIHCDPEAADIVFKSDADITVFPLDVTHKALVNTTRNAAFRALGSKVGETVADLTGFYDRFNRDRHGDTGAPLHDPCTIAYLIRPDMFAIRPVHVAIETMSELTLGMTVVDWWASTGQTPNAHFAYDIDANAFFALLTERLARL